MNRLLHQHYVSKQRWIDLYGGQDLLDAEGFDVIPCRADCGDPACRGWRVVRKPHLISRADMAAAMLERVAVAVKEGAPSSESEQQ